MKLQLSTIFITGAGFFVAAVEARFGQEQAVQLGNKVRQAGCVEGNVNIVDKGIGGQEIRTLLAAADPCDKLRFADTVVEKAKAADATGNCKNVKAAIDGAMDLVAAEKNFNPFNTKQDSICLTAGIPKSPELQGILQLVDPSSPGAAAFNAKVQSTLSAAKAAGKGPGARDLSLAQLSAQNNFNNIQNFGGAGAGAAAAGGGGGGGKAGAGKNNGNNAGNNQGKGNGKAAGNGKKSQGGGGGKAKNGNKGKGNAGGAAANNGNKGGKKGGNAGASGNLAGCNFQTLEVISTGRENRFGLGGQQVALNPAIPTQRICDRASQGTCKDACTAAKAAVDASGVKGISSDNAAEVAQRLSEMAKVADQFNAALGNKSNFVAKFTGAGAAGAGGAGAAKGGKKGGKKGGNVGGGGGGAAAGGSCNFKKLQAIKQGVENRFGFDGRQVALNPAIPAQNICDSAQGNCKTACLKAKDNIAASGIKGFQDNNNPKNLKLADLQKAADKFNAELARASP
ncbi:hypothetical protein HDU97_004166 [Phlyctochytrium planicorne]|nr:hypothetical protein HDU97_004166 [Phlyctochytrium planicorne]